MLGKDACANGGTDFWEKAALGTVIAVIATASLIPTQLLLIRNTPLLLVLLLPVAALLGIPYLVSRRKQFEFSLFDGLLLIFYGYLIIRNDASLALVTFVCFAFFLYYVTSFSTRSQRNLEYLLLAITGISFLISCYAVVEFVFQRNLIFPEYFPRHPIGVYRVTSTLSHPVVTGAFLLQTAPFSIALFLRGRLPVQRRFGGLATLSAALAVLLTFSKGSWLTAGIMIIGIILFVGLKQGRKVLVAAGLSLIVLLSAGFYWYTFSGEQVTRSSLSYDIRVTRWSDAVQGISDNPVTGVGFRRGSQSIFELYRESLLAQGITHLSFPVDNYYLDIFLEEGIIGLLLWALIAVLLVAKGVSTAANRSSERPWALAALLSITSLLLTSVTFDALNWWPVFVMFWVSAGILSGLSGRKFD